MYLAVVGIVFFACLAMSVREGIWSNTIMLFNIIFCGLIAFGFYSPLTIMVDEWLDGEYTYVLDFVTIWGVFVIAMIIARIITDRLSQTRLRLKHPLDTVGGPLVGAIAAFVMTSFVIATLYTAPLAKSGGIMGDNLARPKSEIGTVSPFVAPEAFWLRFVEKSGSENGFGSRSSNTFDAPGFVDWYVKHREQLEKAPGLTVKRG